MKVGLRVSQRVVEVHGLCLCSSSQNHKPVHVCVHVCVLMLLNWDVRLM